MLHVQKYLKGYKNKEITNTNLIRDMHLTKMFQKTPKMLRHIHVLAENVERKVEVNQDESLTDLQTLIKYSFLLNFLHESLTI